MKPVLGLAALLAGALIGLLWWLRAGPQNAPAPSHLPSPSITETVPDRPAPRQDSPTAEPTTDPRPTTYTIGDVIVRDHRTSGEPLTVAPDFTPPGGVQLEPAFAQQVTNVMADPVKQCLQAIPSSVRTTDTRINVTMTVAVKNASLTVTDVAAAVPGLDEVTNASTLGCLRAKMIGRNIDAAGQPDVPSYLISTFYTAQ
jgi:hypothetical protein